MDLSTTWQCEVNKMLAVIEHQVTLSFGIIHTAFKRNGLSLGPEFKRHFLNASNTRIKETYDRLELVSMLENHMNERDTNTSTNVNKVLTNMIEPYTVKALFPIEKSNNFIDTSVGANSKQSAISHSAVIEIRDSDDEGRVSKRPIIGRGDSSACIKVEDGIKAEQPEIDDGVPIVVVDVPDEMVPTIGNVSCGILNDNQNVGRPGVHGIENGITRDAIRSSKTMNKIPNACSNKGSLPRSQEKKKRAGTNIIRPAQMSSKQKKGWRQKCSHCEYTTCNIGRLKSHIWTHTRRDEGARQRLLKDSIRRLMKIQTEKVVRHVDI
ncbi:uncharacterized protein LOC116351357 [Contarinia nasturtii]|uniref:uncharacterized protein LOC116351357 n=1 Tax=Contarinia nasturtii TaxID=265458 RepID=UPI0012D41D82|nr:uncharacterized protein LOC116351357 [Contarinia nasturtii]